MPDPPSGLPFNAKPQSRDLRSFLKKYNNIPTPGAPIDDPEQLNDYKKVCFFFFKCFMLNVLFRPVIEA